MSVSLTNLGINGLEDIEQIGTGGSSRVYRALQTDLDRVVAVKVITSAHDRDVARRFDRERKAMGRLSLHEGIVPVYSTGTTTHGEPYLVMPYYDSGSLQDRIEAGPIDWPSAVQYVDVAAETMAAAHQAGVVHLDLKPANILLTEAGAPRVADFGIAKLTTGPVAKSAQTTSNPAFTPAYSAPETFLDGETGPESDVYGLGATLWALLVGHPPFLTPGEDTNLMAVIGRVVNNPVGNLRAIAPNSICEVVERAMAKQPEDRFQTATEFSEALKAASATEAGNGADQTMLIPGVGAAPAATGASLFDDSAATQMIPAEQGPGPVPLPASMASTVSEPSAAAAPSRPLLQETAQPLAKPMVQPVAPNPILDLDRFRLGPILLGLVAFLAMIGLALFAFNAVGGSDSDDNVAISNPAAPDTSLIEQDSTQLTTPVPAAGSDVTLSTAPTTATTVAQAPATTAAAATTEAEAEPTTTETTEAEPTTTETTEAEPTTTETTEAEPTTTETTEAEPTTTEATVVETIQAPTGLAGTPSADSVALTWLAPTSGPTPTRYQVLRDGTEIATITGLSMADSDVTAGEEYSYTVRSVGDEPTDLSTPSAAVTVKIPENVVELTANASTVRTGSEVITIRVTASKCITYTVEAVQVPDGTPATQVVGPNGTPCTDSTNVRIPGLTAETEYAITVTVTDGDSVVEIPTFQATTDE